MFAILYDVFLWLNFIYIEPKYESRSYFKSFVDHKYVNRTLSRINSYIKKRNIEKNVVSPWSNTSVKLVEV